MQPAQGYTADKWETLSSLVPWAFQVFVDTSRSYKSILRLYAKNAEKSDDRMKLLVGSIHLQKFKLGTKTLGADHLIKEVIFYFTLHFSRIVGEHQAF